MSKYLLKIQIWNGQLLMQQRTEEFDDLVSLSDWWAGHSEIHRDYWREENLICKTKIYQEAKVFL